MLTILKKSRLDNSHDAEMAALCSVDLLIVDDFALEPMSREESKDIYQLFIERTARASVILTSNRDTAEWLRMFDDILLAQSAIDRFMNAAYDLVIGASRIVRGSNRSSPPSHRPTNPSRRKLANQSAAADALPFGSISREGDLGHSLFPCPLWLQNRGTHQAAKRQCSKRRCRARVERSSGNFLAHCADGQPRRRRWSSTRTELTTYV